MSDPPGRGSSRILVGGVGGLTVGRTELSVNLAPLSRGNPDVSESFVRQREPDFRGEGSGVRGQIVRRKKSKARSPEAIEFARSQRRNQNDFATTVWQMLRSPRCCGRKFRREYPIPPYTADFCCVELKLIVEVDGSHHETETGRTHDRERDKFLRELGYEIIRIPGHRALRDPERVLAVIEAAVDRRSSTNSEP